MTREQILQKVKEVRDKWSAELGELTDIWVHPDILEILDDRPMMARVVDPLCVDDVYVTPFSSLDRNKVRIAFITKVDFDNEEESDEPVSTDGSTLSSK